MKRRLSWVGISFLAAAFLLLVATLFATRSAGPALAQSSEPTPTRPPVQPLETATPILTKVPATATITPPTATPAPPQPISEPAPVITPAPYPLLPVTGVPANQLGWLMLGGLLLLGIGLTLHFRDV
ncbi:MAG: hypothetical protein K8R89_02900 [Anaerolineae bacterium]|nr:hypothetical protein [Anaerolineae bacterium]